MGTFSGWQGDLVAPQEWREPRWLGYNTGASAGRLKLEGPSAGSGTTSYLLVSKTNQWKSVIVPTLSFGLKRVFFGRKQEKTFWFHKSFYVIRKESTFGSNHPTSFSCEHCRRAILPIHTGKGVLLFFSKLHLSPQKWPLTGSGMKPSQLALWPTGRSSRNYDFEGQNGEIRRTPELQDEFSKRHINPLGGLRCILWIILFSITEMWTQNTLLQAYGNINITE